MHRKIISALLAVILVSGLTACRIEDAETETTTSTQAVTTTVAPSTEPTTATTTAAPTTTAPTTKKPTTTKKVTTTVKKVVTTIVETTRKTADEDDKITDYRTEEHTDTIELKYGVYCTRAVNTTYAIYEDGSEEVCDEDVTEVYTRIGYMASYEDLLPAAEENKKKYKSEINEVLDIINSYREEGGIEPLVLDDELTTIACARAEEIAWSGRFSHYRPNNKFFSSILKDAGITKGSAGENIGRRFTSAADVCQAWKESETHYENIMNPEFTRIGIGVAADPDPEGKLCWSQLFIDKME